MVILFGTRRSRIARSPRLQKMNSKRSGFTLVEILAAVVLLSIGCLALLAAIPTARESQQRAVNMAVARNLAQSKIDWLRYSSYDTISSYSNTQNDSSLPNGYWTIQTSPVDANLCAAVVTVGWQELHGGDLKVYEARKLSYATYIVRS